jgi:hypothetical protein
VYTVVTLVAAKALMRWWAARPGRVAAEAELA